MKKTSHIINECDSFVGKLYNLFDEHAPSARGGFRGGEDNEDMDLEKITMSMMGLSKESITTDYLVMASTHVDPVVDVARER